MQCSVILESDHNSGKVKMKNIDNLKNSYVKVGFILLLNALWSDIHMQHCSSALANIAIIKKYMYIGKTIASKFGFISIF